MSVSAEIALDSLNLLVSRNASVRSAAETLSVKDYPSEIPSRLIKAVISATKRIDSDVASMTERLNAKPEYSDITLKESRPRHTFLTYLQTVVLSLVDGSETGRAPSEWIWPIQRIVGDLFPGCQVLVRSIDEVNYFFEPVGDAIWNKFSSLGMEDILKDAGLKKDIWVLETSCFPPSGILTHCLIAHEIGHGIYAKRALRDRVLAPIQVKPETVSRIVETVASQMVQASETNQNIAPSSTSTRLDAHIDRSWLELFTNALLKEILARWAEEFAADVFGLLLFGPAFLLSQLRFLFPLAAVDVASPDHPSPRMRMRLSINVLIGTDRGLGYRTAKCIDIEALFAGWRLTVMSADAKANDPYFDAAYEMLRPTLYNIVRICRREIGGLAYSKADFDADVPRLMTRLENGVPPNELWEEATEQFQPARMASILNTGWLAVVRPQLPKPFLALGKEEGETKLVSLVEKAMEYSELLRLVERRSNDSTGRKRD